ncbi:NUDIX domain-containing protein [Lampropedia aestuarii]|uniref:NUDIX domain-containing protein n=1 Tax=Lampropedia aestuarii TaxID=2562762 RepID=A0A4S5BR95_9BURK|nr:bifunctional nicotinamide-nucleotide adenylyltransferase/Nudix hydroxylase [Lampropedia aestuarii]THJ34909.1 NUDIX domain-containing protein [Lampropedia aestuarii]
MAHRFDAAIFIGRFQPPHSGHLAMLRHALNAAERVVVVLGSAFQSRTPKNPFTWQERRDMLLAALPEVDRQRVQFLAMRDFYDEARWVQAVHSGVKDLLAQSLPGATPTVALVGHFKDASSAYLAQFPTWELLNFPRQGQTDATVVRQACFATALDAAPTELDALHNLLLAHVPEAVAQWLLQWRTSADFALLQQEWQMLKSYHQSWASAPYPPMFITVDALVQCQGHVLLVERGQMPGQGLYALPGGYLEPRDTLWQSCLRELREETMLDISEDSWRQALRTSRVFDHPDRSLRGRTVTHVFHFDLGYGTPPAVQGADDAKAALWVPIAELGHMPERFFDDHFFILDGLLQLTHEVPSKVLR